MHFMSRKKNMKKSNDRHDKLLCIMMHGSDVYKRQTLHCGITRKTIEQIRKHKRKMNIVSRCGSLVLSLILISRCLPPPTLK